MLSETYKIEDLGVTLTSSLNFHQHFQGVRNQARSNLKKETIKMQRCPFFIIAYKTCILLILNYSSLAWSHSSPGDIILLERIQKCKTNYLAMIDCHKDSAKAS